MACCPHHSNLGCCWPPQRGDIPFPTRRQGEESWHRSHCLQVGNAYVIVYSITDHGSFESAAELRIQLRSMRQAEDIPIILVGNKSDLVRCREVSVEGKSLQNHVPSLSPCPVSVPVSPPRVPCRGFCCAPGAGDASGAMPPPCPPLAEARACAMMFDCKFIETSAALQHNVAELFEGVVRQLRLRLEGKEAGAHPASVHRRKESLTKRARRFLDRLVARNSSKVALKVRSKSCHDLSVL